MQPDPVPTSAIRSSALRCGEASLGSTPSRCNATSIRCSVSGRGIKHVGRDFELEAPEFLMAGEVLRWDAAGALCDQREISLAHGCIEFLFRMRVEPGAVATERVHQQQFGGEGGGRRVFAFELRDGVAEHGAAIRGWLALSGSEG